ncbi:MAG TPA: hypothetical protein VN088_08400 [Nocardioides sp.]|nr:hypothetical protein [Nocardioides sp.]
MPRSTSSSSSSSSRRLVRALVLALATLVAGLALGAGLSPSAGDTVRAPRISGLTITDIRGNADDGFDVQHLDGTIDYTETISEALAECQGYDTLRARARCRGHLTTWYADLAVQQQTIRYYQRLLD